jgi:hypothetical protein
MRYALAHPVFFDVIALIAFGEEYKLRSSLCNFVQPFVLSSFIVTDQISHHSKTAGKIILFKCLGGKRKGEGF